MPRDHAYRNGVDWTRLYEEGSEVPLGDMLGQALGAEDLRGVSGSVFIAPYSADADVLVVLIPMQRGRVEWAKDMLLGLFHSMRAGWPWLRQRFARSGG